MCITFFWQSDRHHSGAFSFILANNRDEFWDRPTREANFWGPNDFCLSARDAVPGREGGTWMGLNARGKVAVLLNILGQNGKAKQGRGFLVRDFIATDVSIEDYTASVVADMDKYRGFNLLLFDLSVVDRDGQFQRPVCVSNATIYPGVQHRTTLPTRESIGLSNSTMDYPFKKVDRGKRMFRNIVQECGSVDRKEYLIDSLLRLLSDSTPVLPDNVLQRAANLNGTDPKVLEAYSAINIYSPVERLGSRTSTVMLIDCHGKVDFVEKNYNFTSHPVEPEITISRKSLYLNPTMVQD